jgi:monomeric isocitrate dehydrogenase
VVQGAPMDLSGYYRPDPAKMEAAMRPLQTFNEACPLFQRYGTRNEGRATKRV